MLTKSVRKQAAMSVENKLHPYLAHSHTDEESEEHHQRHMLRYSVTEDMPSVD